jgi:hypothetical protein
MSEGHDHLTALLGRLKLTALRDQLDTLIDEAGRRDLTIREALTLFCEREVARRDQRRIEMAFGLARFPFVRDLTGFDFAAQPSLDKGQIREIATGRFIANGEAVLLLGPPGVGKTLRVSSPWAAPVRPPTSSSIRRCAAKPIISRSTSASALFSANARRLIMASVIGGLPGSGLVAHNPILTRHRRWPPPREIPPATAL